MAICTHVCKAPDSSDIEDECWINKEEFTHCKDCKSCDDGHGVTTEYSEEELIFAENKKSMETYLGSTRREQLQTKAAKLSFKMNVSTNDQTLIRKLILDSMKINFEQEFQDDFISVQITSLNFLETPPSIKTGNEPQAAAYSAIDNSTIVNSTTGNTTTAFSTIKPTGLASTGNSTGFIYVKVQANLAQNASLTNETMSRVQDGASAKLEKTHLFHEIMSAFMLVPLKSEHTKYIIVQATIYLIAFLIAGFSINFRWKKFNEKKDVPKQSRAGFQIEF